MLTGIYLKIRDILKKNKRVILIGLVVWALIFAVNFILEHMPEQEDNTPTTTYEPHTAVMDNSKVPAKLQNPIEEIIKKFIEACNNKEYKKAYELLSEECRKDVYPNIEDFVYYVDDVFYTKKIYNIQNFSNKNGYYIYTVTILDDIMASGLTGMEELEYYEETFVIKEENNNLKLAIRGYIGNDKVNAMYEDEYMKLTIEKVKTTYEQMTYYVKIRNKTDNIIVISDFAHGNEVVLRTDFGDRKRNDLLLQPIVIRKGETKTFDLNFTRFYDEYGKINSLYFGYVRILKSYTGQEETRQAELDDAVETFSINLQL